MSVERHPGTAAERRDYNQMSNRALHWLALFVAASVFVLICSGGLVTSKGVGLSVPDWPTSYGYNMFAFPISRWVGGVLYEHTHRLIASGVGLLTLALAAALWRADERRWMRWLGIAAVGAVVAQGVLGGLRVSLLKDWIGIFHACLAQSFFLLTAFIALATSQWWRSRSITRGRWTGLAIMFLVLGSLIFDQLALGATMRHAHAGLAIPDFPRAYGHVWPPLNVGSVMRINEQRAALGEPPTSPAQILLQMLHRLGAGVIAAMTIFAAIRLVAERENVPPGLVRCGLAGPVLIALQIAAGMFVIWTNKAADVATTHVALGALSFVWAGLMTAALWRVGNGAAARIAPAPRLEEARA